jgi:hypothetical protein
LVSVFVIVSEPPLTADVIGPEHVLPVTVQDSVVASHEFATHDTLEFDHVPALQDALSEPV